MELTSKRPLIKCCLSEERTRLPFAISAQTSTPAIAKYDQPILLSIWQRENLQRSVFRDLWQRYFKDVYVFLAPVTFVAAFPLDHSEPRQNRILNTPLGSAKLYESSQVDFACLPHGLPGNCSSGWGDAGWLARANPDHGAILEDATPVRFAELWSLEMGGSVTLPILSSLDPTRSQGPSFAGWFAEKSK